MAFFRKIGHCHILAIIMQCPNFIQRIRKIVRAVFQKKIKESQKSIFFEKFSICRIVDYKGEKIKNTFFCIFLLRIVQFVKKKRKIFFFKISKYRKTDLGFGISTQKILLDGLPKSRVTFSKICKKRIIPKAPRCIFDLNYLPKENFF
jgi:hypothetical protein